MIFRSEMLFSNRPRWTLLRDEEPGHTIVDEPNHSHWILTAEKRPPELAEVAMASAGTIPPTFFISTAQVPEQGESPMGATALPNRSCQQTNATARQYPQVSSSVLTSRHPRAPQLAIPYSALFYPYFFSWDSRKAAV